MSITENTEEATNLDTNAASAAEDTSSASSEESSSPAVDEGLSGAEAAMARATQNLASEEQENGDTEYSNSENNESGKTDGTEAAGEESESSSESTVEIPTDWPQERQEQVKALPAEAQQIVMDVTRDMEAGLNNGLQTIAEIKEQHQGVIDSMQEYGFSGDRVSEVLATASAFDADPKGTIEALAQEAGIELFFTSEEASGLPPQDVLDDPVKYSKWVSDKAIKDVAKAQEHEKKLQAEKTRKENSKARLQDEFKQAEEKIPNFAEHKTNVIAKLQDLSEGASVEDAYKLSAFDSLFALAEEGQKAVTEVAALKTELETLKKNGTQIVKGGDGDDLDLELKEMTPGDRAYYKAKKKINAQQ